MKPNMKEIAKNIFLYTHREDNPTSFTYEIEVTKFRKIAFTIDFDGTENLQLEGEAGLSKTTTIQPYQRALVGRMTVVDPSAAWSLKCKYTWRESTPDEGLVAEVMERDRAQILEAMKVAAELRLDADSVGVEDIKVICARRETHFVDLEFPPVASSLGPGAEGKAITWRRPSEFMEGPFDVFVDRIEPNDIRQGQLGDCWLMCSLSALAEFPTLVEDIFRVGPSRELQHANAAGVYELRFCKNGEWHTVQVDDYFPCFPEGGPIYSRSNGNELWVLLIEKAYAKLHGGYGYLRNGWAYEALMDLTGAPSFTIRFLDPDVRAMLESGELWKRLLGADASGYLMSASTPGEDKFSDSGSRAGAGKDGVGLVPGHAYTLVAVKQTSGGQQLLCLRNPWGGMEWNGDWSDNSPLWTPEVKEEVGFAGAADDGLFWMCFEDFTKYFVSVNVCQVRRHHEGVPPWHEDRRKGAFTYDRATGEVAAPHYRLRVEEEGTHAFVGVHQEDERVSSAKPYLDLGVTVLRKEGDEYRLVDASGVCVDRQVQLELRLPAGEYLVVPTTTGCRFALAGHEESETPAPIAASASGEDAAAGSAGGGGVFNARVDAALREMFRRLDKDMDGLLKRDELDAFALAAEGVAMNEEVYDWLIKTFDSRDGGLTPDGFVECYVYLFEVTGRSEETIWRDLRYMGYDHDLDLAYARTFVVSVHGDQPLELHEVDFDPHVYEEAIELPIKQLGEPREYKDGKVKLYCHKAGYWGVAFAVENLLGRKIHFKLDCSTSKNVISHRGSLVYGVDVPPGETKVLHHLMPKEQKAWAWGFRPSFSMR